MKKRIFSIFAITILCFSLSSCAFIQKYSEKKQIVTTLYPQYDMACKIIGDNPETKNLFDVTMIVRPGQDSHTYDPSIEDIITIKNADIFIYTSNEMETWVSDIDFSSKTEVINLSESDDIVLLKVEEEHEEESSGYEHHHSHSYDPHYWVYPPYAISMVKQIKDAISKSLKDPYGNINLVLEENATQYINQLTKIDEDIKMLVKNAKNTTMYFGAPFAFYYFAYYYGLKYELVYATCSTEIEPSVETLIAIIDKMRKENIDVIFSKELVNDEACQMIANHTGAIILELHSGHNVSALDFNNPNVSYITIMRQNLVNLAKMLKVDQNIIDQIEQEVQ